MTALRTTPTAYDDLGTGDPTLLLLPGWCGDRTVFAPLAGMLATERRVVVTDLRGHGGRAQETEDFDTSAQVDDLVGLVDQLQVDTLVPVALSHAGWMAVELRRRLGARRVPGIVLLDWMVLGTPPGFTDALGGLQDPDAWEAVRGELFGMWTDGVDSPAVQEYVASMGEYGFAHWSRAGREIGAPFAAEGAPLDALARLDVPSPTLHLYAQPADDGYLGAQQEAAARLGWFKVERLEAHSHFPMLEVPGEVAGRVHQFVASLDRTP